MGNHKIITLLLTLVFEQSAVLRHKRKKMKKERLSFSGLKTLIIISMTVIISSCNGQENRTNAQTILLPQSRTSPIEQISQVVRMMFQDSKGNIWFGTENGAFRLTNNALIHIDNIKNEFGKGVTIKDIAEDNDGKIWIGHTDGISCVDGEKVTNYYESDGLISNDVWCVMTDRNNQVWIGTIEGVCKFDGKNFTPFELPEGLKDTTVGVSSTKMIHNIVEDSRGRIWFSTNGGILIKDNNSLTNLSEKDGLHTPFVNEVIETQKGDFLISTSEGLYKYQKGIISEITSSLFEESKGTGSIVEDSNGNIWFNCSRSIYSLKNANLTEYRISEGNYGPLTFQIYEDQQRRLWFVGFGGAFRLENEKFINITKTGPW